MDKLTSVLLAIGEQNFASILRKVLAESDYPFDVLYDQVLHRRFLFDMVAQNKPDIAIIHDKFLPGDKLDSQEREAEMLEILQQIRLNFDQEVRIVYICIRERNDPFLGKIVGLGVHDIFHAEQINTEDFINQLSRPPKFINVQKFKQGDFNIEQLGDPEDLTEDKNMEAKPTDESKDKYNNKILEKVRKWNPIKKQVFKEQIDENSTPHFVEIEEEDLEEPDESNSVKLDEHTVLQDVNQEREQVAEREEAENSEDEQPQELPKRSRSAKRLNKNSKQVSEKNSGETSSILQIHQTIQPNSNVFSLGTVVIAVGGLTANSGVTSTAISFAKYLKSISKSVAIVELNQSMGFERLHAFYENSFDLFIDEPSFECDGITHYKYRPGIQIHNILNQYDYVVLDMGIVSDTHTYLTEFKRAQIRLVITPDQNWKWYLVDSLHRKDPYALEDYVFILPTDDENIVKSFKKEFALKKAYAFPILKHLYELTEEDRERIESLMNQFFISQQIGPLKDGKKGRWLMLAATIAGVIGVGLWYF